MLSRHATCQAVHIAVQKNAKSLQALHERHSQQVVCCARVPPWGACQHRCQLQRSRWR